LRLPQGLNFLKAPYLLVGSTLVKGASFSLSDQYATPFTEPSNNFIVKRELLALLNHSRWILDLSAPVESMLTDNTLRLAESQQVRLGVKPHSDP